VELLLSAALLLAPAGTAAQQPRPLIEVTRAAVSTDTIALGDRFTLDADVLLAPSAVAFLPDSIVGRGFEPFGTVEWSARESSDGGTVLTVRWPLIAFGVGTVEVPEFEVFAADAAESAAAGLVRDGRPVGDFEGFVQNVALVPSARLRPVPTRQVWVASVLHLDEIGDGIAPRPPADVVGGDRNWPATLLTLLFGGVFLGVATVSVRDWASARSEVPPAPPPSPQQVALDAFDALLAGPLLEEGRTRDFFARSSEITRRCVESFEARWGPAWTGTELMDDLVHRGPRSGRAGTDALLPDPEPLRREIETAERVKFGGLRPDTAEARAHAARVRAWIASVPEADAPVGAEDTR
jgi:hypothetical protein